PRETLSNMEGFVVADTEWNKPHYNFTEGCARFMAKQTSVWLQNGVKAEWFACDRQIYTEEKLRRVLEDSETAKTCLYDTDQTGLNLLLAMEGLKPRNLNLPPYSMEATWAGDYPCEFESIWKDPQRKPIFIHWAGPVLDKDGPINELCYKFLTKDEAAEWRAEQAVRLEKNRRAGRWPIGLRVLNAVTRLLYPAFRIQPRPR